MNTIEDRLIAVIADVVDGKRRYIALEELTGISQDGWKSVWHKRQKPTLKMIEAVAKLWPDYAYWLACGDTEPERGHVAPPSFASSYPIIRGEIQRWAKEERAYKQRQLANVPTDSEDRAKRDRELRDAVFDIREKHLLPAVHLNFERIMRAQDMEAKDELFMLEFDDELRDIRINRWKEESKIQQKICDERVLMGQSIQLEKIGAAGIELLNSIWKILKRPFKK